MQRNLIFLKNSQQKSGLKTTLCQGLGRFEVASVFVSLSAIIFHEQSSSAAIDQSERVIFPRLSLVSATHVKTHYHQRLCAVKGLKALERLRNKRTENALDKERKRFLHDYLIRNIAMVRSVGSFIVTLVQYYMCSYNGLNSKQQEDISYAQKPRQRASYRTVVFLMSFKWRKVFYTCNV